MIEPAKPIPSSLQGILVDLLREAHLGLTPASILEVLQERRLIQEKGLSERGAYQRVLRALQQLESMGVVSRPGRRYVLNTQTADHLLEQQAQDLVAQALQGTALTADPDRLKSWLERAVEKLISSTSKAKDSTNTKTKTKNSKMID
jgi:hypothetical protein